MAKAISWKATVTHTLERALATAAQIRRERGAAVDERAHRVAGADRIGARVDEGQVVTVALHGAQGTRGRLECVP